VDEALEMLQILRSTVGQSAFEMIPNELVRIDIRRIPWEAMDVQARVPLEKRANRRPLVLIDAVPKHAYGSP